MSSIKPRRRIQLPLLLLTALALSACGFHLRRNAGLPASMQRVHLAVNGSSNLQRQLARALVSAGAKVEDSAGPGIAELAVPTAAFSTDSVTAGGYARISEYAVHYSVRFSVTAAGQLVVPPQTISMSREYSVDASNPIGNASQLEQIEKSLDSSMVQAIMFRLQAAAKPGGSATTPR